jgi:hypothetical protein
VQLETAWNRCSSFWLLNVLLLALCVERLILLCVLVGLFMRFWSPRWSLRSLLLHSLPLLLSRMLVPLTSYCLHSLSFLPGLAPFSPASSTVLTGCLSNQTQLCSLAVFLIKHSGRWLTF